MMDEAEALASSQCSAMVAAAGCGKTHLIATAVGKWGRGHDLVLTHTHAGVDALRARLRRLGVQPSKFRVDTIAGFALRYAASFPRTSGIMSRKPRQHGDWLDTYRSAARLLRHRPVRDVVRRSYTGVYVDEYQDCTVEQHNVVLALADVLPCRLLGDPLQGIFDFDANDVVDWDRHIRPTFTELSGPAEPWRWKDANVALGAWLQGVRSNLLAGNGVALNGGAPLRWTRLDGNPITQVEACRTVRPKGDQTVVAICKWSPQGHTIARKLRGMFSCVEAIECKDLFSWAERIASASGHQRAIEVLDFAAKCVTGVKTETRSIRRSFEKGKRPRSKSYPEVVAALSAIAASKDLTPVAAALDVLAAIPGVPPDRRELLGEMRRAVREFGRSGSTTLADAAWTVRDRTRVVGRRLARFSMGTPQLVKGLEFDHAVVLDADQLDREELYVALTRARTSLTVLSRAPLLAPNPG